jgi:hypothetical protein
MAGTGRHKGEINQDAKNLTSNLVSNGSFGGLAL